MMKVPEPCFSKEPRKYIQLCIERDRQVEIQCGDHSAVLVSRETWDVVTAALRRYVEFCQEAEK